MPARSRSAEEIRTSVFAALQPAIDAVLARGGRLVPLQIGDTHLLPPEAARYPRHAGRGDEADLYRYGPIPGVLALREALAAMLASRGGELSQASASWVLPTLGATHAGFCAARATLEAGDEVLLPTPCWPLAPGVIRAGGALPVEVPLTQSLYADESSSVRDALDRARTPRTRAIYLITPNNPDGKVWSRAQLAQVASFAEAHDLWVLADEVYGDFAYAREHVSIASLPGMAARTLTFASFSKSHGLAGARVGWLAGPPDAIDLARRVSTHSVYALSVPMQQAALAALRDDTGWVEAARREYVAARDLAASLLAVPGVRAHLADGGSYLFVDFAEALAGRPLATLLERAIERGVLVAPGAAFGSGFDARARVCFTAVPRKELAEGLAALRDAIDSLGQ